jgi:hypothetical protein
MCVKNKYFRPKITIVVMETTLEIPKTYKKKMAKMACTIERLEKKN